MGRGRAKAKQTKVARKLKYSSGGTDLDALRRELVGAPEGAAGAESAGVEESDDEFDDYDAYDDADEDDYAADGRP